MVNGGGWGVTLFVLLFHVEFMWRGTDWRGAVVRFDAIPSRPCARRSLPASLICAFSSITIRPPPITISPSSEPFENSSNEFSRGCAYTFCGSRGAATRSFDPPRADERIHQAPLSGPPRAP